MSKRRGDYLVRLRPVHDTNVLVGNSKEVGGGQDLKIMITIGAQDQISACGIFGEFWVTREIRIEPAALTRDVVNGTNFCTEECSKSGDLGGATLWGSNVQ